MRERKEITLGGLAQLARASALHAEGHRFDSDILHRKEERGDRERALREEIINRDGRRKIRCEQRVIGCSLGSSPTHRQRRVGNEGY